MGKEGVWRAVAEDFLALLFPGQCAGCGRADRRICWVCRERLAAIAPAAVVIRDVGFPVFAAGIYAGVLRGVLHRYKYGGWVGARKLLAGPMRAALAAARAACESAGVPQLQVVALPSSRKRLRERGFNHLQLLLAATLPQAGTHSARAARQSCRVFTATRSRRGQKGLSAAARWENAAQLRVRASWRRRLRGSSILLVDDVVTTGATLNAAAAALRACGARVVAAVALCTVTAHQEDMQRSCRLLSAAGAAQE